MTANVSGLCVVALNRNLKLTTTLHRAITQNPCYVPFFHKSTIKWIKISLVTYGLKPIKMFGNIQ